jgi:hypothetical protein
MVEMDVSSMSSTISRHIYDVRPRKDKRRFDLISNVLPFGRLWYDGPQAAANAIGYAQFYSRSHDAVIRIYDAGGNVIETYEHKVDFKDRDFAISACSRILLVQS